MGCLILVAWCNSKKMAERVKGKKKTYGLWEWGTCVGNGGGAEELE